MAFTEQDRICMARAIQLARRGLGRVSPNPPVGCIIHRDGQTIAEGYHETYGGPHAEANALRVAGANAQNATACVTLMPCAHHGKTPPCTEALIAAGVSRVVVAVDDPHPVSEDGKSRLESAGIPVETGLLADEAAYVMRGYLKHLATGLPFVTWKYAMTLDGKIATRTGDSRWVSGEASRARVQRMRSEHDAILVGVGTILADDPRLNVRDAEAPQPRRVIVDTSLRTPPESRLFAEPGGEIVIYCRNASGEKADALRQAGATVVDLASTDVSDTPPASPLPCPSPDEAQALADRVPLEAALRDLAARGIRTVLCEAGGEVSAALLRQSLLDEVATFVAPKLCGGREAPGPLGGAGAAAMTEAKGATLVDTEFIDGDMLLTARLGAWPWMPGNTNPE